VPRIEKKNFRFIFFDNRTLGRIFSTRREVTYFQNDPYNTRNQTNKMRNCVVYFLVWCREFFSILHGMKSVKFTGIKKYNLQQELLG